MKGFINLYKPAGISSAAAVSAVKKKFHTPCGHMAEGVLPVGIYKTSRLFQYLLDKDKRYVARFRFGFTTDTLDVTGREKGYHNIDSLFLSVNVFDEIIVTERKDEAVRLSFCGVSAEIAPENSNAYRAAEAFVKKFGTCGADISIKRNIPTGGGLGGSSADAAGVLAGLARLYNVNGELDEIADDVGSDVSFMLRGGFAREARR